MQRVLIVDDHPSFRASARAILEADGFDVVGEAVDCRSAAEATRALDPDVILLDVQLPDGSGFDACELLLEPGTSRNVVIVSSRDASEYEGMIESCRARGFIPKAELSGETLRALIK